MGDATQTPMKLPRSSTYTLTSEVAPPFLVNRLVLLPALLAVAISSPLTGQLEGNRRGTVTDSTATAPDSQRTIRTDAWGVRRNGAVALAELVGINALVWAYNEYPRGADFTDISPDTYASNITQGFTWDDNNFANNMFSHPFHGNLYYNAARSNGFNYWASVPFAFLGSFLWECCGETHPAALNDWVATSMGGSAIGEALYRMSSSVLDNTSTGLERFGREVGATALNPVRGFNRIVSGRVSEVGENPDHVLDRWPTQLLNTLYVGYRRLANDPPSNVPSSFGRGAAEAQQNETGFVEIDFEYGSPFGERRKPFDHFTFNLVLNTRDKGLIGALAIRGHLWSTDLVHDDNQRLIAGFAHNYDFIDNNAVEFGGQSVSAFLLTRIPVDDRFALQLELGGDVYPMAAVNSEFAFLAEVPDTSRLREYDMGYGLGGRSGLRVLLNGRTFIDGTFDLVYSRALNGSVGTLPEIGPIDASHVIQAFTLAVRVPVIQHFGVGVDLEYYRRESNFANPALTTLIQVARQMRVYLTWEVGRGFQGVQP